MPTENELKYVLNIKSEQAIKEAADYQLDIEQGYLLFEKDISVRIRNTNFEKFEMTLKKKVSDRVIELENEIERRDFDQLWLKASKKIQKIRYVINSTGSKWEVDAFRQRITNIHTYFLLAEHEMPEGMEHPSFIPDIISQNLIYAVPRTDNRFASGKLANLKYSVELYNRIFKEKEKHDKNKNS